MKLQIHGGVYVEDVTSQKAPIRGHSCETGLLSCFSTTIKLAIIVTVLSSLLDAYLLVSVLMVPADASYLLQ